MEELANADMAQATASHFCRDPLALRTDDLIGSFSTPCHFEGPWMLAFEILIERIYITL